MALSPPQKGSICHHKKGGVHKKRRAANHTNATDRPRVILILPCTRSLFPTALLRALILTKELPFPLGRRPPPPTRGALHPPFCERSSLFCNVARPQKKAKNARSNAFFAFLFKNRIFSPPSCAPALFCATIVMNSPCTPPPKQKTTRHAKTAPRRIGNIYHLFGLFSACFHKKQRFFLKNRAFCANFHAILKKRVHDLLFPAP